MSGKENVSKIQSNEEIINDLTKDLVSECALEEKTEAEKLEEKGQESEDTKETIPDDFIEETVLKDIELTLSEEDLKERQAEAADKKAKGNEIFKKGDYLESIRIYTEALRLCPLRCDQERAVLYCNRAAAKVKLKRDQAAIDDCSKAIELNDKYVRAYLRRGKLYEETEKLDESLGDYKKVIELDPGNREALSACARLPPLIEERNEKMKAEMLGKLKDLGNMILRPFGLSTDNFKLEQDPKSGGYSVNFQQNPRS